MKTIERILADHAKTRGEKNLFTFLGKKGVVTEELSFNSCYSKALAIAEELIKNQAVGKRAILMYTPGLEFISAFFACLYAKSIAVPAFPLKKNKSALRVRSIIEDSGAQVILTTRKVYNSTQKLFKDDPILKDLLWICTDEVLVKDSYDIEYVDSSPEDVAYLQYTSGSTDTPKGVMITHQNIISNLKEIDDICEHTENSRLINWMPLYHDMGLIFGILQPVFHGFQTFVMAPVQFIQDPFIWLDAISRYKIKYSLAPNFAIQLCIDQITEEQKEQLDLSHWHVGCGAEPIRADTLREFAKSFAKCGFKFDDFAPCYGLAEATLKVTAVPLKAPLTVIKVGQGELEKNEIKIVENGGVGLPLVSCGKPSPETKVVTVDPITNKVCAPMEIGEIWVNGPSVAKGYYNRPGQGSDEFGSALNGSGDSYLRTGDLGFLYDEELYVTGRLKELIIIRGLNHYPQDIEYTAQQCDSRLIPQGGACFSEVIDGVEQIVLVHEVDNSIAQESDSAVIVNEICSGIREAIFQHHDLKVHEIVLIRNGSILKTSSGKIQRSACKRAWNNNELFVIGRSKLESKKPQNLNNNMAESDFPKPNKDNVTDWLVERFSNALNMEASEIEYDESLAQYGFDSSIAAALTGEINAHYNLDLDPTIFWEYITIDALSDFILEKLEEIEV